MKKKILLADEVLNFSPQDLPLLVQGKEKMGASLMTVSLVAELCRQREKILFLSGYPSARIALDEQTETENFVISCVADLVRKDITQKQVVFLHQENEIIIRRLLRNLPDLTERILVIKNFELFTSATVWSLLALNPLKVILAGDLDRCLFANQLSRLPWQSKLIFTPSLWLPLHPFPTLNEFEGYFVSTTKTGKVRLEM